MIVYEAQERMQSRLLTCLEETVVAPLEPSFEAIQRVLVAPALIERRERKPMSESEPQVPSFGQKRRIVQQTSEYAT